MTTIQTLAAEYDMQPHAVRAALDLGDAHDDQTDITEFDDWTEAEARDVLTAMTEHTADLA